MEATVLSCTVVFPANDIQGYKWDKNTFLKTVIQKTITFAYKIYSNYVRLKIVLTVLL